MNTQLNTAEGFIKVYDHIMNSLGNILPIPTWKMESIIFALKISAIICGILLIIYTITILIVNNKLKAKKGKKRVTKYSQDGKIISENTTSEDKITKTFCDKTFKNGNVVEKVCYKKGDELSMYIKPFSIIVCTLIVFFSVFLFNNLMDIHFKYRLRKDNIFHNMFIEYIHKLIKN